MKIKIKKLHPDAIIPSYAYNGDAGLDLTAISISSNDDIRRYNTGIAIEIPEGYVGLIFPRSSITNKTDLILGNSVGVIDSGYRGEITFQFRKSRKNFKKEYKPGDKVGQLIIMPYPKIILEEVNELSESERNKKGYGSSD